LEAASGEGRGDTPCASKRMRRSRDANRGRHPYVHQSLSEYPMNCDLCDKEAKFYLNAVRFNNPGPIAWANLCLSHSVQVAVGVVPSIKIDPMFLADRRHDCYLKRCGCLLPKKLDRCHGCTKLADVGILVGRIDVEPDYGGVIDLCAGCALDQATLDGYVEQGLKTELKIK
jgi:hypothetical protein